MSDNPYIDAAEARLKQRMADELAGVNLEAPDADAQMDLARKAAVDPVGAAMGEHGRDAGIVDAQGQPTGPAKHYRMNCEPGVYAGEGAPVDMPGSPIAPEAPAGTPAPAMNADAVAVVKLLGSNQDDTLLDYTVHTPPGPPDMDNFGVFFLHWVGKHLDELVEHAKRERTAIKAAQMAVAPIAPANPGTGDEQPAIRTPGPLKLISGDGKSLLSTEGGLIDTDTKLH